MGNAIVWVRRDLRLTDQPALQAVLAEGHAPVFVYVHAPHEEASFAPGAASRAWLHRSLAAFDAELRARGSRLVIRAGDSLAELEKLIAETKAVALHWNRRYEPACIARDARIKAGLKARGLDIRSHSASLLFEPWTVTTRVDEPYRVFTPFWRNARARLQTVPLDDAPERLPDPDPFVLGLSIDDLGLLPVSPEPRWDLAFDVHWQPGEAGAFEAFDTFLDGALQGYGQQRDRPDRVGTSRLSPHLHFGEISPHRIVSRLLGTRWPAAVQPDVERFLAELGWREFANHLLFHFPDSATRDWNPRFRDFRWAPARRAALDAWRYGRTGIPLVDAGMRELWATGWMHGRVRMIVASFLCKHLRMHWRHGAAWFHDTLVDADLANNTLGWQWSAGTGADATPYFRIFNPATQARRFDPQGRYLRRWLPELAALPDALVAAPWEKPELTRRLAPDYPEPIVDLAAARAAALGAYSAR